MLWTREWEGYKVRAKVMNSPLLPQLLKQAPSVSLNDKVSLHWPEWFNLPEGDAIEVLKIYTVDWDINEVNNIDLNTTVQKDKEGIRSFFGQARI